MSVFAKVNKWNQFSSSQIQFLSKNSLYIDINKKLKALRINLSNLSKNNTKKIQQLKNEESELKKQLKLVILRNQLNKGKYRGIKNKLDHSYHGVYSQERQRFHDKIIETYLKGQNLSRGQNNNQKVIFTAGAMGVGKGYALEKLKGCSYPRGNFVIVDPDRMKNTLPEFKEQRMLRQNMGPDIKAGAAGYVHKESGYLAEIIQEIGFEKNLNIIVDGSLKDYSWNSFLMKKFKKNGYKVEIIYVDAPSNTILKRVKDRARKTGRDIPQKTVLDNIKDVSNTVRMLSKDKMLVNRVIRIDNEGVPTITSTSSKIPLTLPKCKTQIDRFLIKR